MTDPILLTTNQAAEYCGVSVRTIWRWYNTGHIKKYGGDRKGMPRWNLWELDTRYRGMSR